MSADNEVQTADEMRTVDWLIGYHADRIAAIHQQPLTPDTRHESEVALDTILALRRLALFERRPDSERKEYWAHFAKYLDGEPKNVGPFASEELMRQYAAALAPAIPDMKVAMSVRPVVKG